MTDMRPSVLRGGPRYDGIELEVAEYANIVELFADFIDTDSYLVDEYAHDGYSENPRIYNYIGQRIDPNSRREDPDIVDIFVDIHTGDITAGHNG